MRKKKGSEASPDGAKPGVIFCVDGVLLLDDRVLIRDPFPRIEALADLLHFDAALMRNQIKVRTQNGL